MKRGNQCFKRTDHGANDLYMQITIKSYNPWWAASHTSQGHSNKPIKSVSARRLHTRRYDSDGFFSSSEWQTNYNYLLISVQLAHLDTEIEAGAHDNVTTKKQLSPSWLSFSVNNYNLCRVAKSSNHWLAINKHFCHLLKHSLAPSLTLLRLLSNDIWPREVTQQPGKLKPLKELS